MHHPCILSIDVDYFVSPIAYGKKCDGDRLPDEEYKVRPQDSIRLFLEQRCHFSRLDKTQGIIITHHDEAFDKIKEAFEANLFSVPIDLYHVDAHSDIDESNGWGEMPYLLGELMHKPLSERSSVQRGEKKLNCSNWLTFCVANQWLRNIYFLGHKYEKYGLVHQYFPNTFSEPDALQMELIPISDAKTFFASYHDEQIALLRQQSGVEPSVSWRTLEEEQFMLPSKPDYVLVCQSPSYTPQTADVLIEVMREYLR